MTTQFRHRISIFLLMFFQAATVFAQKYMKEGDRYFDRNLFEEAIPFYLKEINRGHYRYRNEAREKLANCYRLTGRFLEAAEEYKQILDRSTRLNKPEHYLNYANSLKNGARYAEAAEQFKKYMKLAPDDPMGKVYLESCNMAQQWLDELPEYIVNNVTLINSEEPDFAPVYYDKGIIFTSSRPGSTRKFINFSENIGVTNTDLYYINLQNTSEKPEIEKIPELDSYMHEGDACFTSGGKEAYFTRTTTGEKNRRSNTVLSSLQIYYSRKDSLGHWSEPVSAFSFNSDKFSVGQPSISADGKTIYYMSDMKGGEGATDIYCSTLQEDGTWGRPVNLGDSVNTFGHELFPHIQGDDTLYFSSDTHPGMGKLDIFRAIRKDGKWGQVTNMKPPINSIGDDFGIIFNQEQTRGFFSSDRFNGVGKDDIYSFYKEGPTIIYFAGHKIQIPDLTLFNGITYKIGKNESGDQILLASGNGMYEYPLDEDTVYHLVMRKNGFFYDEVEFSLKPGKDHEYTSIEVHSGGNALLVGGYASASTGRITDTATNSSEAAKMEKYLPHLRMLLLKEGTEIDHRLSDEEGFYMFSDTLDSRKEFTILAMVPETDNDQNADDPALKNKTEPDRKPTEPVAENTHTDQDAVTDSAVVAARSLDDQQPDRPVNSHVHDKPVHPDSSAAAVHVRTKHVVIRNAVNGNPLTGCDIRVNDARLRTDTEEEGQHGFDIDVPERKVVTMVVNKNGFYQAEKKITDSIIDGAEPDINIYLEPIVMNKTIRLTNILFDYNQATLREESKRELDKLAEFLKVNPGIIIELNGHTDSRGSYYFNLALSYRRIRATKEYLSKQGIAGNRIIAHGWGESFPMVRNAKTEKEHELNRRIEFRVIEPGEFSRSLTAKGISSGLYLLPSCPYSDKFGFARNPVLPDSLFYRIKIGRYSHHVSYSTFKGLFPVVEEFSTRDQDYHYFTGFFKSFDEADRVLSVIRDSVCRDAYVKAFYKQHPVTIAEALAIEQQRNEKYDIDVVHPAGKNTMAEFPMPVFGIQVGAFRHPLRTSYVHSMREKAGKFGLYTTDWKGYTICYIGEFRTYDRAFTVKQWLQKQEMEEEFFIVAWLNGSKIPVSKANELVLRNPDRMNTAAGLPETRRENPKNSLSEYQ